MGIKGLETYLEADFPSDCCYEVKIKQLVEDFCEERGELEKPVIVFHFSHVARTLLKGTDWIHGGQSKEALDKIRGFLSAFQRIGVRPVFFLRGFSDNDEDMDPKEWYLKGLAEIKKVNKFFDCLEKGISDSHRNPRFNNTSYEDLAYYLSALYGCEVHKATSKCNREIVSYARNNGNCIAIFAQNSTFVIHGGAKYYLSAEHFKIGTMTTRNYSREGLANKLGLEPCQLPLFGTLASPKSDQKLKKFLRDFIDVACKGERFSAIANYIRQLPYDRGIPFEEAIPKVLPLIADEICRKKKEETKNSLAVELLASRICRYSCTEGPMNLQSVDPAWNEILSKAEELHRTNKNPTIIRKILNDQPFQSFLGLEDLRNDNLPPSLRITRPLRQKLYGILLKEQPLNPEPHIVTEWCVEGPDSPFEPFQVEALPPADEHPGLIALWSNDRSEEMQNLRWNLFAHSISPHLDHTELLNLPVHLIIPTSAIHYLWECGVQREEAKEKLFHTWEVNALIATMIMLKKTPCQSGCPPIIGVDPRAVHVASIFNRTLNTITDILALCGYPLPFKKTFADAYFNGRLFQKKYREAKSGSSPAHLCQNSASHLAQFRYISNIVFRKV